MFFHNYVLKFIILNSYEKLKIIEFNPKLNTVESFRTHFYSDSSVSFFFVVLGRDIHC